jgi:hypothetical protein
VGEGESGQGAEAAVVERESPVDARAHVRVGARVLTMEKARQLAAALESDIGHNIESASLAVGLRPSTVRDALSRFENDKCTSDEDEAVAEVIAIAKSTHIKRIRNLGFVQAELENRAGTAWMQWQLEVQAPKEHPRKTAVEHSGPDGGAIETNERVRYIVSVPQSEPE